MPKFERDPLVALIIGILVILSGFGTLFADIVTAIGSIICGAGIIVFAFYWQKKRTAKAEEEAKLEALKAEEAARIKAEEERKKVNYIFRTVRVVGVTYKNEDGKSRQTYLRKIKYLQEPFNDDSQMYLEEYEFEGQPAIKVLVDGYQIGHVSKEDVSYYHENIDMFATLSGFEIVGGNVVDGERLHYGARFCMKFYASAEDKAKAESQAL